MRASSHLPTTLAAFYAPPFEARVYHLQLPARSSFALSFLSLLHHPSDPAGRSFLRQNTKGKFLFSLFSLILSFLGVLCSLQSSKHCVYRISTLFCFPIRPPSLLSAPLGSLSHRDGESQQSRVNTHTKSECLIDVSGFPPQTTAVQTDKLS